MLIGADTRSGSADYSPMLTATDTHDVLETPRAVTHTAAPLAARIAAVDAYRGLVMLLMFGEVLRSCAVAAALPASELWALICTQQTHAAWAGASLHDLIQPSFYFVVGIGLFLSMRRRLSSGATPQAMARHVAARSLILIVLGMAILSAGPRHWQWWFVDTLTQIGLAYPFAYLIARRPPRDWGIAIAVILIGYWLWFAMTPPLPDFAYSAVGVPPGWIDAHGLSGFGAHWQIGTNAAAQFDRWLVNLFPADEPFIGEPTGLTTLNFIPSIATMLLGLFAASTLSSAASPHARIRRLCVAGGLLLTAGSVLGILGVCPIVKSIWTPSWVLFSGGLCYLMLAAFYAVFDVGALAWAAWPLRIAGTNSIVGYVISRIYPAFAFNGIRRIVGSRVFGVMGPAYDPAFYGCVVLAGYWLVLYVLYRRRVFVRV